LNKFIILGALFISSFFVFSQDKIIVTQTKLNSSNDEYSPVYYKNGLVFSSVSSNDKAMTGLYFIPFKKNHFGKRSSFSDALKTGLHEGAISFSSDGKIAYFTRTQSESIKLEGGIIKKSKLGVYKTTYDGTNWGNITDCNFNSPEFSFGHPSLASDGKRMYIASDIDGGFGGKDIYYVEITEGICGPLINLGEEINSSANEFFPSISADGKLYFSSDKAGGIGGLDIYSSTIVNKKWCNPVLLDAPINSEYDDFSIAWHRNATEGYFASNRKGSDDIFKINIEYPDFTDCVEMAKEQFCFDFFEDATIYVDTVEMIYEWDFGDGVKDNSLNPHHCYKKVGKYKVNLSILDKIIGEKYKEEASFEIDIKEVFQPTITLPDSIVVGEDFIITVEQGKWKDYKIENFYIDYGDSTITKNSGLIHQYLTKGDKELRVLITGQDSTSNKIKMNCFYKTINVKQK
jgi:hypothetical protein